MYISVCAWCRKEQKGSSMGITTVLDTESLCKDCDNAFLDLRREISGKGKLRLGKRLLDKVFRP